MRGPEFYRAVAEASGELDAAVVRRITAAVFHALRDRLTADESDQVFAQLPWELRIVWVTGESSHRRPVRLSREQFYARVQEEAGLASMHEARAATRAVFAVLQTQISPGEADDVSAQLPADLKEVWAEARA
jgi:uncharacterized protein (DUF2267 family)